MNIEEIFTIGKLNEMLQIVKQIISDVDTTWRVSYVTLHLKQLHRELNLIMDYGRHDHPRNYFRAELQFKNFLVVKHVCNDECNKMIGVKSTYSNNCLYIALILMKDSFEFILDDWKAASDESGRQIHSGIEYYYVSVFHLKVVIERLIK